MEVSSLIVLLVAVLGLGMKIERRLSRIEMKLDRCPHVKTDSKDKGPLVHREASF